MSQTLTLDTLGGGKARHEFDRELTRLASLGQGEDEFHEVTLRARIRRGKKKGSKQVSWTIRAGIAAGRREVAVTNGKTGK
jgi:hypothetical protein